MLIALAALSALVNVLLLGGIPFLVYYLYHRRKHKRTFKEIAQRAGLQVGEFRYTRYCLVFALGAVAALLIWPPSLDASVRDGSAFQAFEALGLSALSISMALIYGIAKTGFAEEFLFRGLIAGSLGRHLSLFWANALQALIFLLPHMVVVVILPEMWLLLPLIFVSSLFVGWVRIRSGSMLGPWLIHAVVNITVALSVAIRSAV